MISEDAHHGTKFFKNPGTRPPVPGAELGAKIFTETAVSNRPPDSTLPVKNGVDSDILKGVKSTIQSDLKLPSLNKESCDSKLKMSSNNEESIAVKDDDNGGAIRKTTKALTLPEDGREPEGSADITPPFSESSNSNSTPPYVRWSESLRNLVSDQDGMQLFAKYLKSENVYHFLEFWFACEGLRKNNASDVTKLVKVINKKFMREQQVPVSEDIRRDIQDRIKNKEVDRDIFDGAQNELERYMTETVYRNFLASEEYLNYVQKIQIGESDVSAKASGSHSTASSVSGGRQIQDDSGHFSVPIEVEKPRVVSSRPGEGTTSDSTSGISETSGSIHHHHHATNIISTANNTATTTSMPPPASATQHNNTANLSTANTTAVGNSSIPASTLDESDCAQLINSLSMSSGALPTLHENSELDLSNNQAASITIGGPEGVSDYAKGKDAVSKSHSIMGLTSHSLMITQKRRHVVKPEAFAGHYLQSGSSSGLGGMAGGPRGGPAGGPRNPYHAYNSAYNPVSRQDSELQSLSSDAHTTDDNMSSFTEGSSHSYRQITSRKHIRRQLKKAHEQSLHNRENIQGVQALVPRTQRVPPEATQPKKPTDFAAELIKKLEKVKEEQDKHERLQSKLEETQSMVSQDSSRIYSDYLKHNKLSFPEESMDDILDKHFSSVSHFSDKTPVQLRSPGDPTGRPRTPPGFRSGATSMGQPIHHRTLPGRGSTARGGGQMGAPPGTMYHQDLAYFDRDRRVGGGRMDPPPPPPETKNNFVREWVEDVERQSGGGHQYDQRSQSSSRHAPGPSKTSPRSARHKVGVSSSSHHRAQSTDRMSSSWSSSHPSSSGGLIPAQYSHQKGTQMQLEEANRRLASLAINSSLGHHSTGANLHSSGANLSQQSYSHNMSISSQGPFSGGNTSVSGAMLPPAGSANSTLRRGAGGPAGASKPVPSGDYTVAVYRFSHEKDPMPYRVKIYTKNVTLKNVKDLLPKKGSFRFYFKTEVDGDVCLEEETEDTSQVPLWEGKVIVQCRNME